MKGETEHKIQTQRKVKNRPVEKKGERKKGRKFKVNKM
jgi:hypothetical protein